MSLLNLTTLASETREIAHHMHHNVRWYGKLDPQTATEWASKTSMLPYRAISGDNEWGGDLNDEAQVFGTGDTLETGDIEGDFDEILVVANSANTVYRCRLVYGTGTLADAITAKQYSDFMFFRAAADNVRKVMVIPTELIGIYDKIWMQCWNATDNATIDFFVGVHGYDRNES